MLSTAPIVNEPLFSTGGQTVPFILKQPQILFCKSVEIHSTRHEKAKGPDGTKYQQRHVAEFLYASACFQIVSVSCRFGTVSIVSAEYVRVEHQHL
jgi:hypothetical protein